LSILARSGLKMEPDDAEFGPRVRHVRRHDYAVGSWQSAIGAEPDRDVALP
jgi:hypothetical protein